MSFFFFFFRGGGVNHTLQAQILDPQAPFGFIGMGGGGPGQVGQKPTF